MRTYELEDIYMDPKDPWSGILAATAYAVRSTYHTTLQATPGQLVFGRDMIFNIKHIANWKSIKERKQKLIDYNNERENKKRIKHKYNIDDKVLLERHDANKYERPYDGPYRVKQVYDNGTIQIKRGSILDTINIRRVKPYKE